MLITSVNNNKIKNLIKLKSNQYRDATKTFLIETKHLIEEANKEHLIKELIVLKGDKPFISNVPTIYVSQNVMKKLSFLANPSSIMAVCNMKEETEIGSHVLLLDNIQDPGNVGTIIRSANAFSFDTIVLGNNTVSLYNDKVIRSSEGMCFHTNVIMSDLKDIIDKLKNDKYTIYGTNVNDGQNISDLPITNKIGIVIGNEGQGISIDIANLCDSNIYIKTSATCESLNASVAASILMYEVNKK